MPVSRGPDIFSQLNGFFNLFLRDTELLRLFEMMRKARLTFPGNGGGDGNQFFCLCFYHFVHIFSGFCHFINIPKIMPLMVAITMTSETKVTVFLVPSTLRMTSMLGRLSAGPASSRARAGP